MNRRSGCRAGESLRLLERRLGIASGRIAKLRGESEAFAEICADYEECCAKLLSFEQKGAGASQQVRDYLEMREHLERELLRYLEVPDPKRGRGERAEQTKTKQSFRRIISDIT